MEIIDVIGTEELAKVYVASMGEDRLVEFVESRQPPYTWEEKWVLIVSPSFGCPVGCPMCDAGGDYRGQLTKEEILEQIDHLVTRRYPDGHVPVPKFKIQFARMGEPSLNPAVLDVLEELPKRYHAPGLIPSISTVAPKGTEAFFDRLKEIKDRLYPNGMFQLQFSIHTTDPNERDTVIPCKKWSLEKIAKYGENFVEKGKGTMEREEEGENGGGSGMKEEGEKGRRTMDNGRKEGEGSEGERKDRKVTLNFAVMEGQIIDPSALRKIFHPDTFLIKITPLNPTERGKEGGLSTGFDPKDPHSASGFVDAFQSQGYDVILSIGELEENNIGSNCGQYVQRILQR
ncbi:MAG: radical SAM protein [Thermoplasmata archaeon]|nr:radical SAM protein [Thermoplasmata archaeon]